MIRQFRFGNDCEIRGSTEVYIQNLTMGRGYIRGLVREMLNSAFMRLKGYIVEDHPTILPTDGLNSTKCPDHRINGTVYDSFAPKLSIWDWNTLINEAILVPESEFHLTEVTLDDLSKEMVEEWRNLQRGHICKGIREKVSSGQTRNILLNLSDTPGYSELLSNNRLPEMFSRINNLDSVICIYPKLGSPFRGETRGKGEIWRDYLPVDMAAVQWIAGSTGFTSLPDDDHVGSDHGDDNRGSSSSGGGSGGGSGVGAGVGVAVVGGGGGRAGDGCDDSGRGYSSRGGPPCVRSGSYLGTLLTSLGLVAAIGAFAGILSWISSSRNSSKSRHGFTKVSKDAVGMYRRQIPKIAYSKNTKPDSLPKAHYDMKDAAIKLIPPSTPDYSTVREEIDKLIDAEYGKLVVQKNVYDLLDNNFINPLLTACMLFFYLVSRLVDTLVTTATTGDSPHGRILGTHVGVMIFCWIGQWLLQLFFLSILSGPLKVLLSACLVSVVIWLVYQFTGYLTHLASGTTYICHVLWEKAEEYNMEGTKVTMPKRAAVAMVTIIFLHAVSRSLKSISVISVIFKFPSQMLTPLLVVVKIFGWVEVLSKIVWLLSLLMVVLLTILVLEMTLPQAEGGVARKISKYTSMQCKGVSVHVLMDMLWQDSETFIDTKPT